jgi:hypothetical protein
MTQRNNNKAPDYDHAVRLNHEPHDRNQAPGDQLEAEPQISSDRAARRRSYPGRRHDRRG